MTVFGRPVVIVLLTLFVAAAPAVSIEVTPNPEESTTEVLTPAPADGQEESSEEPAPPQRVEGPTFQRPGGEKAEQSAPVSQRRVDLIERLDRKYDSVRVAPLVPDLPLSRVHVDLRAGLCALPPPVALLLSRR